MLGDIIRNITGRKLMEELLPQSEERFRQFAEATFEGIVISEQGRIIDVNTKMAVESGFELSEMIGLHVTDLVAPESIPNVLEHIRSNSEESYEIYAKRKNGTTFPVEVHGRLLRAEGRTFRVTCVRDITERKRAEEALKKSEKALQEAQRMAHLGSWELDPENNKLTWSDEVYRIIGLPPQEISASFETFLESVHPDDKEQVEAAYTDSIQDGVPLNIVHRIIRKNDGEIRYIHNACEHMRSEKGKIIRSLGICHDITERKLAQQKIEHIATEWMTTVDASTDIIGLLDLDWRLKRANLAFYAMIGKKPNDVLGHHIAEILHPGGKAASFSLWRIFEGKREFVTTLEEDNPNNPLQRPIEITVRTIPDKIGHPISIFLTFHDLTHERKIQQEKEKLKAQLYQAKKMEAIGNIASGFAHEVRNPLNAILSISEALFSEEDIKGNPNYQPYITHIRAQVNRLAQLMKDVLELGRPILPANLESVSLSDFCSDILNLWGSTNLAKTHSIRFISDYQQNHPFIIANRARLQQVFLNLFDNAAQHVSEGSELEFRVLKSTGPFVPVRIIDTGTGIPPDHIDRIFEPFFTTRKGGTGLGLSLVKHFVENMRGEIAIWNNDPPPGCTAEVRLKIDLGDG